MASAAHQHPDVALTPVATDTAPALPRAPAPAGTVDLAASAAHVGHWRIELPAERRVWSREMFQIFGIDPAGGAPRFDRAIACFHPEDRDRVQATTFDALASGLDLSLEARIVRPDGEIRDVVIRGTSESAEEGRSAALTGILVDMTDANRTRRQLEASEDRYRALADTLPQMIWTIDPRTRDTLYANRRFHAFYGRIGMGAADRIGRYHPADVGRIELAWRAGQASGEPQEADVRLNRHDGIYRWHKVMIVPINGGDPGASWIGTALDIHDLVIAQQALMESADLLRIAQEAAGAGTWDMDLTTGTIILSPESALMHGLPGTEPLTITGAQWSALVNPDDAANVWTEVERSVKAREIYSAEFRVLLPDGTVRWVHGIGRAYFDAHEQPVRMIGLNFDVQKRKLVEAALIEASAAAETARGEAEKASAAKTDFLASMSHEIRTPLNSILGYAELMLGGAHHRDEDRARLERILGAGHALLTIVDDVLDFSKVEAGRVELDPHPFALATLVSDTMSMIASVAGERPLTLRSELDPALPALVVGDQNRLRQVLLNLMNNAVKFTHAGEVTLSMHEEGRSASGIHLRCRVVDTGIGIPADKLDLLFQRFSQVDGSISRRFGGTGLGLAISKSLIDLMGGEIGVTSRDGVGSTFWFTLVLPTVETLDGPAKAPFQDPSLAGTRILLVEDVAMNQEIARAVLRSAGHRVDVAANGAEAVQAVQRAIYDVVLMDVQMPVMDGIEATRRIRSLGGAYGDLPILALTANVLPEQVSRFKRAGMVDHVGKPFRKDDLLAAVARWSVVVRESRTEIVDRAALDSLLDLLGPETLGRLLRDLEAAVAGAFPLDLARPEAARHIAAVAHPLVSSAGMLGFADLSESCRRLETACLDGTLATDDLGRAEEAAGRALAAMRTIAPEIGRADGGRTDGPTAAALAAGA